MRFRALAVACCALVGCSGAATQVQPDNGTAVSSIVPSTSAQISHTAPDSTGATARGDSSASPTAATVDSGVDPREFDYPAAGICGQAEGPVGTVALGRGDFVPQPRCLVIRRDQRLRVRNDADIEVTVTLGTHLTATLSPAASITFDEPIGNYLAPGVHSLRFSAASAASIWVDPICVGPGATECRSPP